MSDNVPIDLWAKILLNLSVKSLLQCTSVCKKWHSLITSSSFTDTHLSASLRRRHPPFLLFTPPPSAENTRQGFSGDPCQKRFFLTFHTDPITPTKNFNRPFPARTCHNDDSILFYRVVGSIHGLVCLSDDRIYGYTNIIILWNPLIHKSLQLPRPQFTYATIGPFSLLVGFGFDSGTNDYKVVRIVYRDDGLCGEDLLPPLVEVFSINEGFWRTVNADYVQYYCIREGVWTQCFIHGALHWVAYDKNRGFQEGFENVILLFDVGTEVFSTMLLPESLVYVKARHLSVAVIGGLLSVLHERTSSIWVQREYGEGSSWTKMFNILVESIDLGVALQCRGYVETLLKSSGRGMAYDCRDLQLPGRYGWTDTFYAFSYTETLLMLDKQRWFKEEEIKDVDVKGKEARINEVTESGKKLELGPEKMEIDSSNRFSLLAMSEDLEEEEDDQMGLDSDLTDSSEKSVENHD